MRRILCWFGWHVTPKEWKKVPEFMLGKHTIEYVKKCKCGKLMGAWFPRESKP